MPVALPFGARGVGSWIAHEPPPPPTWGQEGLPALTACLSLRTGGLKCPVCSFVYGTRWEFNRHLKSKHGLKLVETEGEPKWEVRLPRRGRPDLPPRM